MTSNAWPAVFRCGMCDNKGNVFLTPYLECPLQILLIMREYVAAQSLKAVVNDGSGETVVLEATFSSGEGKIRTTVRLDVVDEK